MTKKLSDHQIVTIYRKSLYYKVWRFYCFLKEAPVKIIKQSGSQKSFSDRLILRSQSFFYWKKLFHFKNSLIAPIQRWIVAPLYAFGKKYFSQRMKLFIKKYFLLHLYKPTAAIDSAILKDWDAWHEKRSDDSLDIFIFGITSFGYRHQRPQHLALGLAERGHRVFYVENEFISPLTHQNGNSIAVKKLTKNVYLLKLASTKNYFIYNDAPSPRDVSLMIDSLKFVMRQAKVINPFAKIDHPFWAALLPRLAMYTLYDCMDEHGGFSESGSKTANLEKKLLSEAHLVAASSNRLLKKIQKTTNAVFKLNNAGEYDHFSGAASASRFPLPSELKTIHGPIVGYYGAIADWFDFRLLDTIASQHSSVTFVIIGGISNSTITEVQKKHTNVILLGEKPYAELPRYLAHFDVCIIPFIVNDLIKATDPVKIYEYFSAGKPVVATHLPELKKYKNLLYLSNNHAQFSAAITKALQEKSPKKIELRRKLARNNTWQKRVDVLEMKMKQLAFPKVSIVVLTYNSPQYTKETIDSVLLRSKYSNYELIIVDNNSNAETLQVLSKYEKEKKVKLLYNKQNLGFAGGNNVGMKMASGEYIVLLNNDVMVVPGWLARLSYHSINNDVGIVSPVTNNIGNEAKINIAYDPANTPQLESAAANYTYAHWGELMKIRNVAAFCWIKRRAIYKEIGNLDERFGRGLFEDDDYCLRTKRKGYHIFIAEDVFIHHYGGISTKWDSPEYKSLFNENKVKFENKWHIQWTPHKFRKGL